MAGFVLNLQFSFMKNAMTTFMWTVLVIYHANAYDEIVWETIDPTLPYEYFFSKNFTLHKTHTLHDLIYHMELDWYGAREWCKRNGGGDLLDIRSNKEAKKIKAKLALYYTDKLFLFWTGINDLNRDKIWTWENGEEISWKWISREISDMLYVGIEDSLLMRLCSNVHFSPDFVDIFHNGRGNADGTIEILPRNCGTRYPFVCKREKGTKAPSNFTQTDWRSYIPTHFRNDSGTCPTDSIAIGDKCIFAVQTPRKDWDMATKYCRKMYGVLADLVSFHTESDVLSVLAELKPSRQGYWTGFMKEWSPLRKPLYLWADGSRVINFTWTDEWLRDENPKRSWLQVYGSFRIPAEKDRDCAYIQGSSSTEFQVTKCNVKRSFICQIDRRDLEMETTSNSGAPTTTRRTTGPTTPEMQTTEQSTFESTMEATRKSTAVKETSIKDLTTERMVTTAEDEHSSDVTLPETTTLPSHSYSTEVSSASRTDSVLTSSTNQTTNSLRIRQTTSSQTTTLATTSITRTTTKSTTPLTTLTTTATTMKLTITSPTTVITAVSTSTMEPPCREGFTSIAAACYKVVDDRGTFDEAELVCRHRCGAHLASVSSASENAAVELLIRSGYHNSVWLGLKFGADSQHQYGTPEDKIYFWTDGTPMFYSRFHPYPDLSSSEDGTVCLLQVRDMGWSSSACDTKNPFVCKYSRQPGPTHDDLSALKPDDDHYCPPGFFGYGNRCFDYDVNHNRETSFRSAMEKCTELSQIHQTSNGMLAVPNTDFKRKFVTFVVSRDHQDNQYESRTRKSYWMGIYRDRKGEVRSVDGSDISDVNIPLNEEDDDNCVVLIADNESSYLQWDKCDSSHSYVCTIPKFLDFQKEQSISSVTVQSGVHCPKEGNWRPFNGYCYLFLPNHFRPWSEANKACESHNIQETGNRITLASIHSTNENRFVQVNMKEHNRLPVDTIYWIGGYHHPDLGWRWADESEFDYNSWIRRGNNNDDYYDDYGTSWKCIAVSEASGMWMRTDCNEMHGSVCKIAWKMKPDATAVNEMTTHSDVTSDYFETTQNDRGKSTGKTNNFWGIGGKLKDDKPPGDHSVGQNNEPKGTVSKSVIIILLLKGLLLVLVFVIFFLMLKRQKLNKNAYQHCVAPVHFILSNN